MYKYTAPSTVLLALRQRFRVGGSIRVKGSKTGTHFLTLPYPYSEHAYRSSESVHNTHKLEGTDKQKSGQEKNSCKGRVQTDGPVRTQQGERKKLTLLNNNT